jgi:OHCU decarboxylase
MFLVIMIFGYAKERKLPIIGMKILVMKIEDINNYNSEKFIDSFKNIYEESKFITEHADKKRPFKNKKEMILIFLELFDNLDEETKINIIKKHPDLADKIKINKGLSELSDEEQSRSGLKDCSEQEFNLFKDLNSRFKNKFNIPFIFAVRNKNKNEIITEFKSRLDNNDLSYEFFFNILTPLKDFNGIINSENYGASGLKAANELYVEMKNTLANKGYT